MHLSGPVLLFSEADIFHDFALTGVLLGILLFVIVVPLTRMDLRRGVSPGRMSPISAARRLLCRRATLRRCSWQRLPPPSLMGVGAFACVLLPLPLTVTGLMLLKGLVRLRPAPSPGTSRSMSCAPAKRGLNGGLQSPGAFVGTGGDSQSTPNRRCWETRDAPRLFFCVMVSVTMVATVGGVGIIANRALPAVIPRGGSPRKCSRGR